MKQTEPLLTKEEVSAVAQFSEGLYLGSQYGYWSPFLSNQFLQNLNNDAKQPTVEAIRKALADYRHNADTLQSYIEFANHYDMLFARTVESYVNSLAFDLQYVCTNAYTKDEYESEEYKADKRRVVDFLNKFNYKDEFRKIVQQLMLHEVYFVWFRKQKHGNAGGMKYAIQILPQDRCLLTGYWEKSALFDFDMSYFLQAGTDINGYDPVFKKYYKRVFEDEGATIDNYRPTNQFNDRTGTYALWTQTSPADGAWAFKRNLSNFNTTPFLAPYLKSVLTNDEVEQLQYNKDIAEAFAILAGEIKTFDGAKSGMQPDQMTFKPATLGQFMGKVKSGLGSLPVKLAAMPVEELDWYQFEDKNPDMYKTQLTASAGVGTGISRLIYSSDRMSNAEVEGAQNEVYQTMKPLYEQFGNFLEFYINQITKKYHFKFMFDGATYRWERAARVDNLHKIADKGLVLPQSAWASALGYQPQLFEAMLAESKYTGWIEEYSQTMLNINTTAGEDKTPGRPELDSADRSDSAELNHDQ